VLAFVDYTVPHLETYRQYAKHTDVLPKARITEFIFAASPYSWFLPALAAVIAVDVFRRKNCSLQYLIWYVCIMVMLASIWTVLTMLGIFLVDPVFTFGPTLPSE